MIEDQRLSAIFFVLGGKNSKETFSSRGAAAGKGNSLVIIRLVLDIAKVLVFEIENFHYFGSGQPTIMQQLMGRPQVQLQT